MSPGQIRAPLRAKVGKRVANNLYVHTSALPSLPASIRKLVEKAVRVACVDHDSFNVVRVEGGGKSVSLLLYPRFFDDAFPSLAASYRIDIDTEKVSKKRYNGDTNPPILHRKETLLAPDDVRRGSYEELTKAAEGMGLFEDPTTIGTKLGWEARLERLRLRVEGHRLVEIDGDGNGTEDDVVIQRHRTALQRYSLSTPMQALWRHGFLQPASTVFDYGCGRGDDIKILQEQGIAADGWDPHFRPKSARVHADVVNLGFVINVIEAPQERRDALRKAFDLAQKVLSVSALIGGRSAYEQYRLFRDGVVTARGTFQKYFTQQELKDYLEESLGREPVAVAPGIFFVFKDDSEEQAFLAARQTKARCPHTLPKPITERLPRESKWDRHRDLLDDFWSRCLELGRMPTDAEYARFGELKRAIGSPKTVLRRLQQQPGSESLEAARRDRMDDLQVYLALNLFERRKSFRNLPESLRRDISVFWGSWTAAQEAATALLYSLADPTVIHRACVNSARRGVGYLEDDHDLQLHSSLVPLLPAVLRVYVGCASRLYGEVDSADIIKVHITSGKLTLMSYADFETSALPRLLERVKINLRNQQTQFFDYVQRDDTQVLYHKSRYLPPSFPNFEEQKLLDVELARLAVIGNAALGPSLEALQQALAERGISLQGFRLVERT